METYRVGGRSVATAATSGHASATLWNASTTKDIFLTELHFSVTTAGSANAVLRRATARGTAGSTVTPDIDNATARTAAPVSGALLDLAAYTTQPTLDASELDRWVTAAAIGAGKIWVFAEAIKIPQTAGMTIATSQAAAFPASDYSFVWRE